MVERTPDGVLFDAADADTVQDALAAALKHGAVTDFSRQQPTLAEIFKEVVR